MPCRTCMSISRRSARNLTWLYVGRRPSTSVAPPINAIESVSSARPLTRSPTRPRRMLPTGRAKNPSANVAKVRNVGMVDWISERTGGRCCWRRTRTCGSRTTRGRCRRFLGAARCEAGTVSGPKRLSFKPQCIRKRDQHSTLRCRSDRACKSESGGVS